MCGNAEVNVPAGILPVGNGTIVLEAGHAVYYRCGINCNPVTVEAAPVAGVNMKPVLLVLADFRGVEVQFCSVGGGIKRTAMRRGKVIP